MHIDANKALWNAPPFCILIPLPGSVTLNQNSLKHIEVCTLLCSNTDRFSFKLRLFYPPYITLISSGRRQKINRDNTKISHWTKCVMINELEDETMLNGKRKECCFSHELPVALFRRNNGQRIVFRDSNTNYESKFCFHSF